MRLHLGCGSHYIEGMTNIELPENRHYKADIYSNIMDLKFADSSVSEILIEHVFEHFDRVDALVLLIRWSRWLREGGKLIITTPDFLSNSKSITQSIIQYPSHSAILRHIFGSNEAGWAVHKDGWYLEKFENILPKFGIRIERSELLVIDSDPERYDIRVISVKDQDVSLEDMISSALGILSEATFQGETELFNIWKNKLTTMLGFRNPNAVAEISSPKNVAVLIFSKDRAMQLDCALRSLGKYCNDLYLADIKVLYKCSDEFNKNQYWRLQDYFQDVDFREEGDFRNNVLYILSGYEYVLFCVDDSVFIKEFSIQDALDILQNQSVIGMSLRLGENTDYCYMSDRSQKVPEFINSNDNILTFEWPNQEEDFAYPLELSSSIYRADDIYNLAMRLNWNNPNTLEFCLHSMKSVLLNEGKNTLACYERSVAFANPINKVQDAYRNNRSGHVSASDLADKFHKGCRISLSSFADLEPNSCHQEVDLQLIQGNFNSDNPTISFVIPTRKSEKVLLECLWSIMRNTNNNYEIIIIDNSDGNFISKNIKDQFPQIHWIQNTENNGAAAARNQGLALVKGKYVACLDDDVVLTRNWDSKFIRYFNLMPNIGFASPMSNWASGPQLVTEGEYNNIPELEKFASSFDKYQDRLTRSARLVGFCFFMKKEVIDKIGGFDARMKFNFEDDDFTIRAWLAGFHPVITNGIFIHHSGGPVKDFDKSYIQMVMDSWSVFREKWGLPEGRQAAESYSVSEFPDKVFIHEKHYFPLT